MDRIVKVNYQDSIKEYKAGTTLLEISNDFKENHKYPILIAKVDNQITPLSEVINKKVNLEFFDRSSQLGTTIYANSLRFILVAAVKRLFGHDAEVVIEHSIDKGFYCELLNNDLNKELTVELENEMAKIVSEDLVFKKVSVLRLDAIRYFKNKKQMDKVKLLKYVSNSHINLQVIDNVYDYFFGELAYSTKDIDNFKLTYIKDRGFVVSFPDIYNPEKTMDYVHHEKLFDKFYEFTEWGRNIDVANAADLNEYVSTGKYEELIMLAEAHYDNQLSRVADQIYEKRHDVKFVLIAGPSSSGKTTTAKKLEIYLGSKGLKTHQISLDDYFLNREDTPKDENGEYDFECLEALDVKLFNTHLTKLLEGEKILIPTFNFVTGKREYKDKHLQMGERDIVIIEGLHGLNEKLTSSIDHKNKFKIYVSPLTQLNIDNHNRIHTSDTRRLRRIVRDNKYRGYSAAQTLKMWKKIRAGEEKYIFPFQDDADYIINSALVYELGVLKIYAEPLLYSVAEDDEVYPEAIRLINNLKNVLPIPSDGIPNNSMFREFIGGSSFKN